MSKKQTQCARVLQLLSRKSEVSALELSSISLQYAARVCELRKIGSHYRKSRRGSTPMERGTVITSWYVARRCLGNIDRSVAEPQLKPLNSAPGSLFPENEPLQGKNFSISGLKTTMASAQPFPVSSERRSERRAPSNHRPVVEQKPVISTSEPNPLLDEGEYLAECTEASFAWAHQWRQWKARLVLDPHSPHESPEDLTPGDSAGFSISGRIATNLTRALAVISGRCGWK